MGTYRKWVKIESEKVKGVIYYHDFSLHPKG
jgi:hypothetical protein